MNMRVAGYGLRVTRSTKKTLATDFHRYTLRIKIKQLKREKTKDINHGTTRKSTEKNKRIRTVSINKKGQ